MQFRRADLADLPYFLEVRKHRNFRRAGAELGVSASALSHALRGSTGALGIRLLNRTSRSVTLTAAGEELHTKRFDRKLGRYRTSASRSHTVRDARTNRRVPTEGGLIVRLDCAARFVERLDPMLEFFTAAVSVTLRLVRFSNRYPGALRALSERDLELRPLTPSSAPARRKLRASHFQKVGQVRQSAGRNCIVVRWPPVERVGFHAISSRASCTIGTRNPEAHEMNRALPSKIIVMSVNVAKRTVKNGLNSIGRRCISPGIFVFARRPHFFAKLLKPSRRTRP